MSSCSNRGQGETLVCIPEKPVARFCRNRQNGMKEKCQSHSDRQDARGSRINSGISRNKKQIFPKTEQKIRWRCSLYGLLAPIFIFFLPLFLPNLHQTWMQIKKGGNEVLIWLSKIYECCLLFAKEYLLHSWGMDQSNQWKQIFRICKKKTGIPLA